MQKILQDYPLPILGLAVFTCVCIMVALHGRAGYWQKLATEHQSHHHRYKASHSSLAVRSSHSTCRSSSSPVQELEGHPVLDASTGTCICPRPLALLTST
jgi:hypothetical protein